MHTAKSQIVDRINKKLFCDFATKGNERKRIKFNGLKYIQIKIAGKRKSIISKRQCN